jgi:hypothetical protein
MLAMTILILILSSCGGGAPAGRQFDCTGACGVMQIVVKNAKSFNPGVEHGHIVSYRVTITGDGIESPIVSEFDGSVTEGRIDGVPVGSNRKITVDAINPNSLIIRQGETAGVEIAGGEIAKADVTLESVPIFTNIADGNTIDNTRLIFQIFADPSGELVVEDVSVDSSSVLADASAEDSRVNLDTSTGLGRLAPVLQPEGQHRYKVRNLVTGRSTIITVNLADGTKRKGAPFFAAGDTQLPDSRRRVSCGTH